jgi:hypothetical protein
LPATPTPAAPSTVMRCFFAAAAEGEPEQFHVGPTFFAPPGVYQGAWHRRARSARIAPEATAPVPRDRRQARHHSRRATQIGGAAVSPINGGIDRVRVPIS